MKRFVIVVHATFVVVGTLWLYSAATPISGPVDMANYSWPRILGFAVLIGALGGALQGMFLAANVRGATLAVVVVTAAVLLIECMVLVGRWQPDGDVVLTPDAFLVPAICWVVGLAVSSFVTLMTARRLRAGRDTEIQSSGSQHA